MWISLRFLLSEVLFSSLIGVYPYRAWKQLLFFYYHLYMMFSPISPSFLHHLYLMIFLLNLAAGHTAYHIYAVIFISYIWCIYALYHHLYLIIISRFADPQFLRLLPLSLPVVSTVSIIAVGTATDIWHGSRSGTLRHMRYIWHMWCIQSMWQQHGQ